MFDGYPPAAAAGPIVSLPAAIGGVKFYSDTFAYGAIVYPVVIFSPDGGCTVTFAGPDTFTAGAPVMLI